jgi:glutathione S-transferase
VELLTIISLLAVIQFVVFGAFVGAARGRSGLKAPAVTGDEQFERYFRVHYNTLEQLVAFLPGLWAFGMLINVPTAAGLGLVYLVGRLVYFRAYVADPATRGIGMFLSAMPGYILLVGGLGAAIWRLVPH